MPFFQDREHLFLGGGGNKAPWLGFHGSSGALSLQTWPVLLPATTPCLQLFTARTD